jgi:hypothetical protein
MRNHLPTTIVATVLILGSLCGAYAADSDKAEIEAVLRSYERVLNASDVDVTPPIRTKPRSKRS